MVSSCCIGSFDRHQRNGSKGFVGQPSNGEHNSSDAANAVGKHHRTNAADAVAQHNRSNATDSVGKHHGADAANALEVVVKSSL
ncbi:MAG TPA: hypothetical protein VGD60_17950 [Candidatus Acidoferrales bacterium]